MGVTKGFTTKGAKPGRSGGQYFKHSEGEDYVCEIQKVEMFEPRKGTPKFIAECKILVCDNDDMVGKVRNFFQDTADDWAAPNILEFVYAAHGINPYDQDAIDAYEKANPLKLKADENYWDKQIERMCPKSSDNPEGCGSMNGQQIMVHCFLKRKKDSRDKAEAECTPKDFSQRTNFLPYVE